MRRYIRTLGVSALLALSPVSSFADEQFLAQLSALNVELSADQQAQIQGAASIEEIVALLVGGSTDVVFIQAIVSAAVKAYPDKAAAIVSSVVEQAPFAAGAAVSAAVAVVVDPSQGRQVAVNSIVKAAVTAAPDQAEAVRTAAIAVAPSQTDAINKAVDTAINPGGGDTDPQPPSPAA